MTDALFKEGDLVKLGAGGPVMSVTEVDVETKTVTCLWFDVTHQLQERRFRWRNLLLVNNESNGVSGS